MGCVRPGRYRCRKREGNDGKSAKEKRHRNKRNYISICMKKNRRLTTLRQLNLHIWRKKIYTSHALIPNIPVDLFPKTWFVVMLFLCRRGWENLRSVKKDTIALAKDLRGKEYVFQRTTVDS